MSTWASMRQQRTSQVLLAPALHVAADTARESIVSRACIGCGTEITACMGFGLARDHLAKMETGILRPVRELCGKCVFRCEAEPSWFAEVVQASEKFPAADGQGL